MFKSLIFFVRFFLFWLLFFALDRFIFLFIFHKKLRGIPLGEKALAFYHGLRLDLSMTAYLAVIPLLVFTYCYFTKKTAINFKWVSIYNKVLIALFGFFSIVNFNTYREWGIKINYSALAPIVETPKEAMASSGSSPFMFSMFILAILVGSGFYLNFILIKKQINFVKTPVWIKPIVAILLLGINFLIIRGGVDVAPNNQSMAYYSKYEVLNHAALNTEWNLISSILASKKTNKNPYLYFDNATAEKEVAELYKVEKDTTILILKNQKPNVIIFILESFTADLTKTLGNEDGITPGFDSLINKGVLFTSIYAAGSRTDKGLVGTLTGFPTLGTGSIVKWPEKMQKIPAISQKLSQNNYQTSFYYGGESEFDNYKAFLLSHNYQKLIDKNSFEKKDMNSKWGAYDGLVFNKQLQDINQEKQPFFSTILSLTNHEPFEVPGNYKFGSKDIVEKFKSTAYYTDSCINDYLSKAKKQAWYKNTLFIFVADHGHLYPKNVADIFQPQRYHIPLLFYGDVIKDEFKGKKLDKIGSQQDISATLLAQLNIPHKDFIWSKNLLNPYTKQFAFFSWDNGLGFINDKQCVTFDNIGKNILYNSNAKDNLQTNKNLNSGKSYLQTVYQQFIKL
ncbi:LTA synthase family protein [Pedobacter frigiditerrae]|uniref:LTA synthase family protein n=1 Tax=Pedobacter frigiditerrae TaxID=2530452 RepID=A0A4V2MIH7_9SPHI|nr:LTA synthase family protein [Pedobacter frigiditerrae]TCC90456.1 LTA synthase family protein [Pedobacter frigiditerrae]